MGVQRGGIRLERFLFREIGFDASGYQIAEGLPTVPASSRKKQAKTCAIACGWRTREHVMSKQKLLAKV
jgi:hypothetical protein